MWPRSHRPEGEPGGASTSLANEAKRQDAQSLSGRFQFEHDLLVKRTAAILTLNGLMATSVAVGEKLPPVLKAFMAVAMIVIDLAWLYRAGSARGYIDLLYNTLHDRDCYAEEDVPHDARLSRQHIESRRMKWINTTNVFSLLIPAVLLSCWLGGLAIIGFGLGPSSADHHDGPAGRYAPIRAQGLPPGEFYVLDSQTGEIWRRAAKSPLVK